jgi:hypothetical protein
VTLVVLYLTDREVTMAQSRRGRVLAVTAIMPLLLGLAACGGSDEDDEGEGNVPIVCPSEASETASTQPPDDIPLPEGADSAYAYFPQGATQVWNLALDGEASDLEQLRDDYFAQLEDADYEIEGTDAEESFEAEGEFNGPHEGTAKFRPLCEGKVVVTLKLLS